MMNSPCRPASDTTRSKWRMTMNTEDKDHPETDEFELIELGSVSEETRGGFNLGTEIAVGPNSRI